MREWKSRMIQARSPLNYYRCSSQHFRQQAEGRAADVEVMNDMFMNSVLIPTWLVEELDYCELLILN